MPTAQSSFCFTETKGDTLENNLKDQEYAFRGWDEREIIVLNNADEYPGIKWRSALQLFFVHAVTDRKETISISLGGCTLQLAADRSKYELVGIPVRRATIPEVGGIIRIGPSRDSIELAFARFANNSLWRRLAIEFGGGNVFTIWKGAHSRDWPTREILSVAYVGKQLSLVK